ncbi:FAD dependent oxidoreductase-domain-containing protein [Cercophora newfieldiana]|uniref:FAD dependent oxidoreductase-domain-containing protein n=1 Tax=Cercophora newfieldiana TaxID=92897 RepID=A0AA39Y472_9PEZI|nr:FAD dependent oxidoreductase-domain-containing protein [Cercophora newfieldiana]
MYEGQEDVEITLEILDEVVKSFRVLLDRVQQLALLSKANFIVGSATSINYGEDDSHVKSATYKSDGVSHDLPATDILVAAGPLTSSLLPQVKLQAPKGHSIVVQPSKDRISPYILFPDIHASTPILSPDIYPRPSDALNSFDTIYASGPDYYDVPLPELATDATVEDEKIEDVWKAVKSVSQEIQDGAVITKQACYKAQIRKHEEEEETGPMVGPLDAGGLWLATGLDEWGVQNGPAVGLVMSEMILEGKAKSADVESLDPKHWIYAKSVNGPTASLNARMSYPFPRDAQLNYDFDIEPADISGHKKRRDAATQISETLVFLPGEPTQSLDGEDLSAYLAREYLTPDLDRMHPYLWLVGTQSSSHITALHEQRVKGREILITEQPELHCTWIHDRIFLKPIPAYLLSWSFWHHYLIAPHSPIPESQRIPLRKAALGFLRTYFHLVKHPSDFRLLQINHLIDPSITYIQYRLLFHHLCEVLDDDVSLRYHFGELRLGRLNILAKVILGRLQFRRIHVHYGYDAYFAQFYAPVLFLFAFFSILLASAGNLLQSFGLDVDGEGVIVNLAYVRACQVMSLVATGVCLLAAVVLVALFAGMVLRELVFALRMLWRKRRKRRGIREVEGKEDGGLG